MMLLLTTTTTTTTATNNYNKVDAMVDAAVMAVVVVVVDGKKEKPAEEEERRAKEKKWEDRIESAQHRAFKRVHAAMMEEKVEERAMALRARLGNPSAMWFAPASEHEVTRQVLLVEECLDDVRARAVRCGWAPLAPHWRACLPKGILWSAAMQPYLRRWAAADAAAASVEATP